MSQRTKIEWCDSTFNPWIGCTKVGPGCDHCYAETMNARFKGGNWGSGAQRKRTAKSNWQNAIMWNTKAASGLFVECIECRQREFRKWDTALPPGGLSCCSNPNCLSLPESDSFSARPRVFCASMADWLDNEVPVEWLADLLNLIRVTPNLDWLLLTKRIGNFIKRIEAAHAHACAQANFHECPLWDWLDAWLNGDAPNNARIGVTVCNQEEANRDIGKLFSVPAVSRFLSIEPMLGPIDLIGAGAVWSDVCGTIRPEYQQMRPHIDWVICGGESASDARPMNPRWVRTLRDQCKDAGVPFFFKQWGEWGYDGHNSNTSSPREHETIFPGLIAKKVGKKKAGRMLDGVEWNQFPKAGT